MAHKLPLLVHEDKTQVQLFRDRFTTARNALEQVFAEYRKLDLGELDPGALHMLFVDTRGFVEGKCLDKLTDVPVYSGFKMNRAALLDQLQLPSTHSLELAITAFKRHQVGFSMHIFSMDAKGVHIKEDVAERLLDQFRVYATTQEEAEAAITYKQYRDAYIKLDSLLQRKGSYGLQNMRYTDLFTFEDGDASKLTFNLYFYNRIK